MGNYTPSNNIIFAFLAGFDTTLLLHFCASYGYTPSPDIAAALPAAIALLMAHIWDIVTGDNKKCPISSEAPPAHDAIASAQAEVHPH